MQKYVIALYIRLSMEDCKYDSLSIENQHIALNEFANSLPEAVNAEIIEFIDNGYSGTNFERPKVQELFEMVRENRIDCIIVKDFSRFGRNSTETGYFIERVFPIFHTRFISINDNYDSNDYKGDTGGINVAFKYLINEYYSRDISMKTKTANHIRMKRGEYQSKVCPYGYKKGADGRLEPDPPAAKVVKQIFEYADENMNATQISRKLFSQSIPTPGEYKAAHGNHKYDIAHCDGIWCNTAVLRILNDERYTGTYITGKSEVREIGSKKIRLKSRDEWYIIYDHHTAIIDKELFESVQSKIHRNRKKTKNKRDYILRGKVICGCCNHSLHRSNNKNIYYMCRHSQVDEKLPCHNLRIYEKELEQVIFQTLKAQLKVYADIDLSEIKHSAILKESAAYDEQLKKLNDDKRELFEQYALGSITKEEYISEKAKYDDKILRAKNAYAALTAQAKLKQKEIEKQNSGHKALNDIIEADKLTQPIVDLLIDKIYIFPEKRIEIRYKIRDMFESAVTNM